jgi:hypothetical protein
MILQIDCTRKRTRPETANMVVGFYRMMLLCTLEQLPSYWMYNGTWHCRTPGLDQAEFLWYDTSRNLNPPILWRLE